MKNTISRLLAVLIMAGLCACSGGGNQEAAPVTTTPAWKKEAAKAKTVAVKEEVQRPPYKVSGTRDPFKPYAIAPSEITSNGDTKKLEPLQKLTLSQLELVGVIMGDEKRALVQDGTNRGYIITEGTRIGENDGIVTSITDSGVTIKQHFKDYMGRVNTREVVLSLRKEEGEN